MDRLWWHLYLNAFRHDDTAFMRGSGARIRGVPFGAPGGIDVLSLSIVDGPALTLAASCDPTGPTSRLPEDATEACARLPAVVPPGGAIELRVEFVARLPEAVARTGYRGDFHLFAQWFPKLARLESDGTWAHFPFEGIAEFYADFAHYSLRVDAPEGWQVVSSIGGAPPGGDTEAARPPVHDVVFAVAPSFVSESQVVRLASGHDIRLEVFAPPGYERALGQQLGTTRRGLTYFSEALVPYPYRTLRVIVPPAAAVATSGMEYPALFMSGGPWFEMPPVRVLGLTEELIAHELAHQWFQGLLASNEREHPYLDEGLTTWASRDFLRATYGERRSGLDWLGLEVDGFEFDRVVGLPGEHQIRPRAAAHEQSGRELYESAYVYVPLLVETLSRTYGPRRMRARVA